MISTARPSTLTQETNPEKLLQHNDLTPRNSFHGRVRDGFVSPTHFHDPNTAQPTTARTTAISSRLEQPVLPAVGLITTCWIGLPVRNASSTSCLILSCCSGESSTPCKLISA